MKVGYKVGEQCVASALGAWNLARASGLTPSLDLGNAFSAYDWSQEPSASIAELEDAHAKRIHAKGRPIRVVYSGGTDSHTVASAFARNNIPAVYTLIDYQSLHSEYLDSSAWIGLKLERLQGLYQAHGLKAPEHEVITVDEAALTAHFSAKFYEKSAFYNCNQSFNLNQISAVLPLSKWSPEKTINVYGVEKPRLYEDNIGIYWQITDTMSMYTHSSEYDSTWFYLSSEALELVAKQAWCVLRHCVEKWPELPFGQASSILQTTPSAYYEWNQVLGRRVDHWWASMSRQTKTRVSTFEAPKDVRYAHLPYYQSAKMAAWRNYSELFEVLKDITGKAEITSVLTDRFYLTKKAHV